MAPWWAGIFVLFCVSFFTVGSQSIDPNCPSTTPECDCEQRFGRYYYIICTNLVRTEMPPFLKLQNARTYRELKMVSSSITRLQSNAFANLAVISLMLQDIDLEVIEDNAFAGLENQVEQIHLDSNKLTSIPTRALRNLKKLEYLAIPNNLISSIQEQAFAGISNLEHLYLFGNSITFISPWAFRGVSKLTGLSLHRNKLLDLPREIFRQMTALRELELQYNNLTSIDGSIFSDTWSLERLDLSDNEITALVPGSFSTLSNLRYLAVKGNKLVNIQTGSFSGLSRLKFLYLERNEISFINRGVFDQLRELNTLYMFRNRLAVLPDRIFQNLGKLRQLHLYENLINVISPDAFLNLGQVWDLNLNDNRLTELGTAPFRNIPNLEYLDLQRNKLSSVTKENWQGLSKLKNLRLQGNRISTLDDNTFGNIGILRNLALGNNGISTISTGAFTGLPGLNYLELQENNISELKASTFQSNNQLRTLKLSQNRLSSFSKKTWDGLGQLRHLYVDHNQITDLPSDGLSPLFELLRFFGSNNRITKVGERSFHKLRKLELIDLSQNQISWLDRYCMDFQKKLLELKLSNNNLAWIDGRAFTSLREVADINLSFNNFKTFTPDQFFLSTTFPNSSELKQLHRVSIEGNELVCNCSITWMRGFAPFANVQQNSGAMCSSIGPNAGNSVLCFPYRNCPTNGVVTLNETIRLCEGPTPTQTTGVTVPTLPDATTPPGYDFPTANGAFYCTFDIDFCHFRQVGNTGTNYFQNEGLVDQFDWSRTAGKTPSSGTGPTEDHTTGISNGGSYLYIEASDPRAPGDKALLLFSVDVSQASCLKFFYHMFGANLGTLKVLQRVGTENQELWSRGSPTEVRHDSQKWYYGLVNIPVGRHILFFEGTRATAYAGDIAIDDVQMINGPCQIEAGDACPDKTCKNGGECDHSLVRDECMCNAPFSGPFCEVGPADPCVPNPCGPNSIRCERDGANGFKCICVSGFNGQKCVERIDLCESNPCGDRGRCFVEDDQAKCECYDGFGGPDCRIPPNPCNSNPCQNGGNCVKDNDNAAFECVCVAGYRGEFCQEEVNPCQPNPCQNRAPCVKQDVNRYQCQCPPGYAGNICQFELNPCDSRPCVRGGCEKTGVNDFRCLCPAGYTGRRCDTLIDRCLSSPCQNGGNCVSLEIGGYRCDCAPGWTGLHCDMQINYCESQPCQNGAACRNEFSRYMCDCLSDFTGNNCETRINPCDQSPCVNGACLWNPGEVTYRCQCTAGYEGPNCDRRVDPCRNTPCLNGGSCTPGVGLQYTCQCKPENTGIRCEKVMNLCESLPCLNGATCQRTAPLAFNCICAAGFRGNLCDIRVTPCDSNPCLNNGLCSNVANTFRCQCPNGIIGSRCEIILQGACAAQPCLNGGRCYNSPDSASGYVCQCPGVNERCQGLSNPCQPNPCRNQARCYAAGSDFFCQCRTGFTGTICDQPVSFCASRPCLNNGICSETGSAFICTCQNGFTGRYCQMNVMLFPNIQSMRLVGGQNVLEGRLEVYYQNQWGTVCSDSFDNKAAKIVCKRLGYSGGVVYNGPKSNNPSVPIWLDGVSCDYEGYPSLEYCRHNEMGTHDCTHIKDVAVRCTGNVQPTTPTPPTPTTPTLPPAGPVFTCDFERDKCNMVEERNDGFDWLRQSATTPSGSTGPTSDHSGQGFYIFTEASSPRRPGETARARIPLQNEKGPMCMTFWFHMYGARMGTLQIIGRWNGRENPIWSMTGNKGDQWFRAEIDIAPLVEVLYVEGRLGQDYQSDMAVDDITIRRGTCSGVVVPTVRTDAPIVKTTAPSTAATTNPTTISSTSQPARELFKCSFDQDECPAHFLPQPTNDKFNWDRRKGATPSSDTGPGSDHTSSQGYYMFIETSSPRLPGDTAVLEMWTTQSTGNKCLQFWLSLNGADIGQLILYSIDQVASRSQLASYTGNRGPIWMKEEVNIPSSVIRVQFTGVRGRDYQGDLAIDDVRLVTGPCGSTGVVTSASTVGPPTVQPPTVAPTTARPSGQSVISCDFELTSVCKFSQVGNDDFEWTLGQQDATPSGQTGPLHSHSGSYYAFIESSSPRTNGDTAQLTSVDIDQRSRTMCFSFWYHMYGQDIGTLNIYISNQGNLQRIWSLSGDQNRQWYPASVQFTSPSSNFRIVIEGIRGSDYRSDIGIDDITLDTGACWDFTSINTCNFDNGLCFLHNSDISDFDWRRTQGSSGNVGTGPTNGYNGSGYYLHIDSRDIFDGQVAVLDVAPIPAGSYCLSFYYHMYGSGIGNLNVLQKQQSGSLSLLDVSGPLSNLWTFYQTTVQSPGPEIQISFHATVRGSANGDIALDEIQIKPGICS